MLGENNNKCGCKGVRTCLLCEKQNGSIVEEPKTDEVKFIYTYCPHCNLCWPDDGETAYIPDVPLYLGKLKLFLEFITEDDEAFAISSIDRIPWILSQSGRRKQDFGPKVNFKKKKVKIGEFKGFPKFSECILQKFKHLTELSDFQPVELCHLEYSPERGSSIDPHVDDFWLWGERLVTLNLASSTVLTLLPFSNNSCECSHAFNDFISKFRNEDSGEICHHKLDVHNYQSSICDIVAREVCPESQSSKNDIKKGVQTVCGAFRMGINESKIAVRIVLPPRSLFVLAGCARYNWFHEVKRQDVMSRRLAMTFRELTPEFLDGGKESQLGKELLLIARNSCDL